MAIALHLDFACDTTNSTSTTSPSQEGAHLLLQTRVRTLNGALADIFKRWHQDLDIKAEEIPIAA
jgi:hypothetical protein